MFAQEFAALKSRVQLLQASEAVASSTIAAADERVASLQVEKAALVAVSALLLPLYSFPRPVCVYACLLPSSDHDPQGTCGGVCRDKGFA